MKILYLVRNDGSDSRVRREVGSLLLAGATVVCVLASGRDGLPLGIDHPRLRVVGCPKLMGASVGGKALQLLVLNVVVMCQLLVARPWSMHVVDEEFVVPCWFARLLRVRVVVDVFDSYKLKAAGKRGLLSAIMRLLARLSHRAADAVVVTDRWRLHLMDEDVRRKCSIVPNFPMSNSLPSLCQIASGAEGGGQGDLLLWVGGTLSKGRGLAMLEGALEAEPRLRVLCAGWLYDDAARRLVTHERVDYRGVVDQSSALQLMSACTASLAVYEPCNLNNIYASPNKVFDSLCCGRHVIVNAEARIADWLIRSPLVARVPYGDPGALLRALSLCSSAVDKRRAERYRSRFVWERVQAALLNAHGMIAEGSRRST